MVKFNRPACLAALAVVCAAIAGGCAPKAQVAIVDPAAARQLPPVVVPPPGEGVAVERFFAFGGHGTGGEGQRRLAGVMADRAARDGLDFVVTLGDNFCPSGVKSTKDEQWKLKFENVYSDPALQVPWYIALGNHDQLGDVDSMIAYSRINPRWHLPTRNHEFERVLADGTKVGFFILDTTAIQGQYLSGEVGVFVLDRALSVSTADWKIVIGHHALYSHGANGGDGRLVDRIEEILVARGADLYIAGHDHTLEMLKPVRGVHHVVAGGGGGTDNPYSIEWTDAAEYAATGGGFVAGRLSRDEIVLEFVRMDGTTQFAKTIRKAPPAAPEPPASGKESSMGTKYPAP